MGAFDSQRVHGREYRRGEIVSRRAIDEIAFAVPRIIEGNGTTGCAEMIELRPPDALVGTDAVQEQDRRFAVAPSLNISDAPPRGFDLPHRGIMGSRIQILQARLG